MNTSTVLTMVKNKKSHGRNILQKKVPTNVASVNLKSIKMRKASMKAQKTKNFIKNVAILKILVSEKLFSLKVKSRN